jgi:Rps23 Pro-64 3,4-dihydroxylase Tpa1-like proline 4-hydroxylase
MTPKQILDSFSETLMQDERILSAPERALVTAILHHAKTVTNDSQPTQEAVRAVISSAVGEIVAQRAFAVLGGSIVERILQGSGSAVSDSMTTARTPEVLADPSDPQSPGHSPGQPQGPGVRAPRKDPEPPSRPSPTVPKQPQHPSKQPLRTPGEPSPSDPQSPGGVSTKVISGSSAAVAERPAVLPAQCVVLDEFLSPQEVAELTQFTLEHESDFQASEVVAPRSEGGVVNYEHRRSRVLMDLDRHQDVMLERIKAALPQIQAKLGMGEFSIADVEAQVTASNDGDYFHFHSDNASERVASRHLTFVYFFHREPRPFEGGELRIHDARLQDGQYVSEGSYQTIVPQQNQIVFFPCELMHEITPVKCASQRFADSRFTLNGWLRQ